MTTARLSAAIGCDLRLQVRAGFYYAAAFVAVVLIALLRWIPPQHAAWFMPAIVLFNVQINAFYFIGGLVLLEKGEGSLEALVVTPLRDWEYLASKVATLAMLSVAEAAVVVLSIVGFGFNGLALLAGVMLISAMFSLYGFLVVARYDSINEYLIPAILYTSVLALPLFDYFAIWESGLFYLHPVQAPLILLRAAFGPVAVWQIAYSVVYGGVWVAVLAWLSLHAFRQFVTAREGAGR